MSDKARIVLDTNTLLQALRSPGGPAGRCVELALEERFLLVISPAILAELQEAASRPKVIRKLKLRSERTEEYISALERSAWILKSFAETFVYERDPDDAHLVNLAVAAEAKLIVSRDNDLLVLGDKSKPEGRLFHQQFPTLRILDPVSFLKEFDKP